MNLLSEIKRFLQGHCNESAVAFHEEMSTLENKDYRRGFRAGAYFAFLQMKSDISNIEDSEQLNNNGIQDRL